MEPQFEINQSIQFQLCQTQSLWENGVIITIFTNKTPIQYVVQTSNNEKLYLNEQQIKAIKSVTKTHQVTYNIEFQRILSQLIMQKNEDQLIEELKSLLKRITPQQVMQEQNGAKIIYTTYQFLIMRKPSILRNYPFAPTNLVLKQLKQLVYAIKKEVLKNSNLIQLQTHSNINQNSFKHIKLIKQTQKLSRKMTQIYDDSEKEEQPTAFYANLLPNKSAFRPYKSDSMNHQLEQLSIQTKPSPKIDQIKTIYFKPIIIQGLLC
ncbi:unnamed protein product [Paramecium pentaurelia]|uniref:Uncharacterized protein n=1 Tax=Paramecium pentaurelia TaxID=43138 RepID=A0A8S1YDF6_9CILI|nr:unnamed protein product [Paramecium pentaurelia]